MKRPGSTLIELAVSLPIFSMLMVLAIGAVQQTMRISRLAKDRGQLASTLAKLEQCVRQDVHQANSATVARDDKTGLQSLHLSRPNDSYIVYRSRSNRIDREQIDSTGKLHFNSFALFAENQAIFELQGERSVLVSVHRVHRDHASADRLELYVRSLLGRPRSIVQEPRGVTFGN